jgi:enediyne biosynthesis protein E5
MYQLFIFFTVTDPKTTVKPVWEQCVVVFLVPVLEIIMRLAESSVRHLMHSR